MLEKLRVAKEDLARIRKNLAVPRCKMDLTKEEHAEIYDLAAADMWASYYGIDPKIFDKVDVDLSFPETFSLAEKDTLPAFDKLSGLSKNIILEVMLLDKEKKVGFLDIFL